VCVCQVYVCIPVWPWSRAESRAGLEGYWLLIGRALPLSSQSALALPSPVNPCQGADEHSTTLTWQSSGKCSLSHGKQTTALMLQLHRQHNCREENTATAAPFTHRPLSPSEMQKSFELRGNVWLAGWTDTVSSVDMKHYANTLLLLLWITMLTHCCCWYEALC
jgi:hypothetical protein